MGRISCRVCRVAFAESDLDSSGRCSGCRDALDATKHHTTYGKFMGQRYAKTQAVRDQAQRRAREAMERRKCRNCGTLIPVNERFGEFCSNECRDEFAAEERKAKQPEKQADGKPKCPTCGNVIIGRKRTYCSYECSYRAGLIRHSEKNRIERENRPPAKCRICGNPISDENRRLYCSKLCAGQAKNLARRKTGQVKKGGE